MSRELLDTTESQYKQFCIDIGLAGHENCDVAHLFLVVDGVCTLHALAGHFAEQEIFDQRNKAIRLGKKAEVYRRSVFQHESL